MGWGSRLRCGGRITGWALDRAFARLFAASFPTPLVWGVMSYWRTDRDAPSSLVA